MGPNVGFDDAEQRLRSTASFLITFNIADAASAKVAQAVWEIIVAPGDPIDNYLNDVWGQVTWTLQCQWFPERGVRHVIQLSKVKSDEGEQFWTICSKELMVETQNTAYFAPGFYPIYCCIPLT